MPLPLILGVAAAVASVAGVGSGIHGVVKAKEANDTMKSADVLHKENILRIQKQSEKTNSDMDTLGKKELKILNNFERFSRVFGQIQNRPQFKLYNKDNISIPEYNAKELKEVSIGAGVLLGGIGGATIGTAGGFAAAGATTAAVVALGTASTGTAIGTLSGVALTNATLAALGGGAIAAGGGGMALGSLILGGATLGVGLLVGGIIFNITGSGLSNKADEAWGQMKKAEAEINRICTYLVELSEVAIKFNNSLGKVNENYIKNMNILTYIVENSKKTDWELFTPEEKILTENTSLLVGLLFNMCKVPVVLKSNNENDLNKVNSIVVEKYILDSEKFLLEKNF